MQLDIDAIKQTSVICATTSGEDLGVTGANLPANWRINGFHQTECAMVETSGNAFLEESTLLASDSENSD